MWIDSGILERLLLTTHAGAFATGLILWKITTDKLSLAGGAVLGCAVIALALGLQDFGTFEYPDGTRTEAYPFAVNFVMAAGVPIVLVISITAPQAWLSKRLAIAVGGMTYPLYMLHQEIGYALFATVGKPGTAAVLAVMAMIVLLAFVVYLVEVRIRKWLYRMANAWLSKASGPYEVIADGFRSWFAPVRRSTLR